jgi:hypothetical protein
MYNIDDIKAGLPKGTDTAETQSGYKFTFHFQTGIGTADIEIEVSRRWLEDNDDAKQVLPVIMRAAEYAYNSYYQAYLDRIIYGRDPYLTREI